MIPNLYLNTGMDNSANAVIYSVRSTRISVHSYSSGIPSPNFLSHTDAAYLHFSHSLGTFMFFPVQALVFLY
jgi:hypothetical protein